MGYTFNPGAVRFSDQLIYSTERSRVEEQTIKIARIGNESKFLLPVLSASAPDFPEK